MFLFLTMLYKHLNTQEQMIEDIHSLKRKLNFILFSLISGAKKSIFDIGANGTPLKGWW